MYKQESIKKRIECIVDDGSCNNIVELLSVTIAQFVEMFGYNECFADTFDCEAFNKMCVSLDKKNGESVEENFSIFYEFCQLASIDIEKRNIVIDFAKYFAECSEDEDCCAGKIYVLVKNLCNANTVDIELCYDNWEDAISDIDSRYISCCDDDIFLGETMWFHLLCSCQAQDYDVLKNFCSIVEYDATGLEDARETWIQANYGSAD